MDQEQQNRQRDDKRESQNNDKQRRVRASRMSEVVASFPVYPEGSILGIMAKKIAVKVVTSSTDPGPIYSECAQNVSGLNQTKLKQDGNLLNGWSATLLTAGF